MSATATHGTVKELKVEDLRAGMKLERDVIGRKGKVLASAGEVLSQKHVKKFQEWEKREKPLGPALPKKNPKDKIERVRHGEFEGGYRLSHFNPRGIMVSTTLASGDEAPAVERDPTKSPLFQNAPTKSFAVGDIGIESPLIRVMEIKAEIRAMESTNKDLGGSFQAPDIQKILTEEDWKGYRDALKADNEKLTKGLREVKDRADLAPTGGKKKGR